MIKTPWFLPGQKPEHEGVYERQMAGGSTHYSRWDGRCWYAYDSQPDIAAAAVTVSFEQHLPWRGVLQVQEAPL